MGRALDISQISFYPLLLLVHWILATNLLAVPPISQVHSCFSDYTCYPLSLECSSWIFLWLVPSPHLGTCFNVTSKEKSSLTIPSKIASQHTLHFFILLYFSS